MIMIRANPFYARHFEVSSRGFLLITDKTIFAFGRYARVWK